MKRRILNACFTEIVYRYPIWNES